MTSCAVAGVALPVLMLVAPRPARAQDVIHVEVVGLRNNTGQVGCNVYSSDAGFPTDPSKALRGEFVPIKDEKASCEFKELPKGTYAIAVMHDENSNGKVDTNFLGMPKEGVGASNDAKGMMGPPKFKDAAFDYGGGRKDLTIHMQYLL